jgi:hypothetical protein
MTTLTYGNGPGGGDGPGISDEAVSDATDPVFVYPATFFERADHHGGSDVGVWAVGEIAVCVYLISNSKVLQFFFPFFSYSGPLGYLFHSVHEQSHVGHVIGYALCAGPYEDTCNRNSGGGNVGKRFFSQLSCAMD